MTILESIIHRAQNWAYRNARAVNCSPAEAEEQAEMVKRFIQEQVGCRI